MIRSRALEIGEWAPIVDLVSGYDYGRELEIVRWPVSSVLGAYLHKLREAATAQYRTALVVWAVLAPWQKEKTQPPSVPGILQEYPDG